MTTNVFTNVRSVAVPVTWPDVPLMFSFVDPDGNRFYVSETSAR
jgi:hypothetical protein